MRSNQTLVMTREHDIRRHIVCAIDSGEYPGGSRLPTERVLSETLAVSRSAVRNALAVLEGEGLVSRMPGSGTYVCERSGTKSTASIGQQSSPAQVMEARLNVEPYLAQLVCTNASPLDLAELQRCVQAGSAAEKLEEFEVWDTALHEAIAVATKNPIVIEAYNVITRARDGSAWGDLKRKSLTPERRTIYQAEHECIVEALQRRDAATAQSAIRGHLVRIRSNMLGI